MAPPDPVIETQKSVAVTEAEKKKKRAEMMRKRMNAKLKKKQTKISKTLELEESTSESFVTTEDISNCIQCQEELNPDDWIKHPYGQLGEINQTRLFFHSRKQTYEKMIERYEQNLGFDKDDFRFDKVLEEYFPFLSTDQSGTYINTCGHQVHFHCLNEYKVKHSQ